MRAMSHALRSAIVPAVLALSACVVQPDAADRTPDGLERVASRSVDSVYTAPGMSLAPYRRVMLDSVDVAFKRDWQREHPEVKAEDISDIRERAARQFREVFTRELERGGYAIATQPASDVLRVTASVVDLDIQAPAAGSVPLTRTYVVKSSDISLLAELRDSQSGAVLARVADRKRGREFGELRLANEATAFAETGEAFGMWARLLRNALDDARRSAAAEKP
jgi:hypothetical protein